MNLSGGHNFILICAFSLAFCCVCYYKSHVSSFWQFGLGFSEYTFYSFTFLYDLVLGASVRSISFMGNQLLLCYRDPNWSSTLRNKDPRSISACICATCTLVHTHTSHTASLSQIYSHTFTHILQVILFKNLPLVYINQPMVKLVLLYEEAESCPDYSTTGNAGVNTPISFQCQ